MTVVNPFTDEPFDSIPICEVCHDRIEPATDGYYDKWGICKPCHIHQDSMMHPHKIHNSARVHTVIHKTGHRYDVVKGTFTIGPENNVVFKSRERYGKYNMVSLMIADISAIVEDVK